MANRYALGAVALTVALQMLAVISPQLGRILGTAPLTTRGWMIAVAFGAVPALLGQGWKFLHRPRDVS